MQRGDRTKRTALAEQMGHNPGNVPRVVNAGMGPALELHSRPLEHLLHVELFDLVPLRKRRPCVDPMLRAAWEG